MLYTLVKGIIVYKAIYISEKFYQNMFIIYLNIKVIQK